MPPSHAFDLDTLDALETPLKEAALFPVQKADGRKDWPEFDRQAALFTHMRSHAPSVVGFAIPNAGRRHPYFAKAQGITGGVFDTVWHTGNGLTAYVEMKGYDKNGSPGSLEPNQIQWGNRMHKLGYPVACFFSPHAAAEWLRGLGFPFDGEIASAA